MEVFLQQQVYFAAYLPSGIGYFGIILGPRHKQFHVKLFPFSFKSKKHVSSGLLGTAGTFKTVHFSLQMFVEIYFYKNNFVQSWQTTELLSTMNSRIV